MNLKSLLPWVCIVGLLIGLGWMYAANQKSEAELAILRQDSQQLQQLQAEVEEAKSTRTQAESDELLRLRKDHDELLRLRNEVRQLRGDKQQLSTQLQTAQSQVEGAQAQVQALRATPPPQPGVPQPNPALQAAFAARYGLAATNSEQMATAACINNLRLIDGAKQQWALEHQKPAGSLLTAADLAPYLKGNGLPTCPAGGVYTLNPVGIPPICNIPGHALPK
jgi:ABC-type branched-subunit amino acid transport system substrate-binding protein